MEKVQLQLIIEKLAKFTRQDRSASINTTSQQKLKKPSRKQGHKKSQSAAAAPPGESAQDRLAGILDPLDEEQKTEEQKEMERFLAPIKYQAAGGQEVEIRNFEDIAEHIKLPELNRDVIRGLAKARGNQKDDQFDKLTLLIKPKVDYYKMSLGDRQLYLRRVEKLTYDITEEEELRKQRVKELELQQARLEKGLIQSTATDPRATGGKGQSSAAK